MRTGEKSNKISQRTYMHSPWTQIMCQRPENGGGGRVEVGKGGKNGDIYNSVNNIKT